MVVTIHRLEDAAGLEASLRADGIDAVVTFNDPSDQLVTDQGPVDLQPGSSGAGPDTGSGAGFGPGPGQAHRMHIQGNGDPSAVPGPPPTAPSVTSGSGGGATPSDGEPGDACRFGADPATLVHQGGDWVLTIPADSPLQDRHVEIGTFTGGDLSVQYTGDEPGSLCGVMSLGG